MAEVLPQKVKLVTIMCFLSSKDPVGIKLVHAPLSCSRIVNVIID